MKPFIYFYEPFYFVARTWGAELWKLRKTLGTGERSRAVRLLGWCHQDLPTRQSLDSVRIVVITCTYFNWWTRPNTSQ